jgi:hypothetical protein
MIPTSGDSVIYQNWLMKRSQVTRMFRRRFAVLTASGKLYSFRRADLGKPESIHLTQASLVWDIRGCTVELAPKLGKGTWVLKPTGANLKEEIYLRVCSFSKNSTTEHWMNVMLAVARNNLNFLFDPRRVSILSVTVSIDSDDPLYVEIEGSLTQLLPVKDSQNPTFSAKICVRDTHPGLSLMVCQYSSVYQTGEKPVRKSDLIPRYMFHKSKTTLPWTTSRPIHIQLIHDTEEPTSLVPCSIELQIDEHLRAYTAPLISRYIDDEDPNSLDFSVFKFQIKRLIRLIDKLGRIRQNIADVFEWRNTRISSIWFLYLTVILLLFPRIIPTLMVCHVLYYSLLNSVEFRAWINNFMQTELAQNDDGVTSTTPSVSSEEPNPANQSPRTRVKTAVKDAALTALHQMQSVMGKPSVHSGSLRPEIWENQRRVLGGSQFTSSNLSVFDRSRWSNIDGTVPLEPPSSNEWKIDVDAANSDDNGWAYNIRWGASDWHASYSTWDLVRRRRWIPIVQGSIPAPRAINDARPNLVQSESSSVPSHDPIFTDNPSGQNVASLSGVVTSGPEFGNIHDDYDDANAEHQPKQSGLGSMFTEFKQTANIAQIEIGRICGDIEKYMNLLSWRDELISTVASAALAVLVVVSMFIPVNVIVYLIIFSQFTLGYRRRKWRRVAVENVLKQHIMSLLSPGVSLRTLGGLDAHKLCLSLTKRTGVSVTQKVVATMDSPEILALWLCKQCKAFSSIRIWMKRDAVENYLDHVPPEVSEEDQAFFMDYTHPSQSHLNNSTSGHVSSGREQ